MHQTYWTSTFHWRRSGKLVDGDRLQFTLISSNECLFIILGEVKALKDIWIIGDTFVNEIFHALPGLKT